MDKIAQKKSRHKKLSLNLNKKKPTQKYFKVHNCFFHNSKSCHKKQIYQDVVPTMFNQNVPHFQEGKTRSAQFANTHKKWNCSPENRAGDTVDFYYHENWEGLASFTRIRPHVQMRAQSVTFLFFMIFLAKSLVKKTSHRTKVWSVLDRSQTEDRRKVIPPSWN